MKDRSAMGVYSQRRQKEWKILLTDQRLRLFYYSSFSSPGPSRPCQRGCENSNIA